VAARDLLFRHGATRDAVAVLERLLTLARQYGSIPGQAEALFQLAISQVLLGDRALGEDYLAQSQRLTGRLGAMHRLRFAPVAVESMRAYFFEGDWSALAAATRQFGAAPLAGQGSVGLASAALGAMNHLRAGDEQTARRWLAALAQVHARIEPTDFMYSSTFDRACAVCWELEAREFAAQYRRLAHDLIRDSDSLGMVNAYELDLARMATLLGEHDEAAIFFARARVTLADAGHRPMRAIVDYDEALALSRDLANVYTKIDARGRAEATTYALQHGITPRPRPA
jgi:hypothetical protein